jgi:hypothetical protein
VQAAAAAAALLISIASGVIAWLVFENQRQFNDAQSKFNDVQRALVDQQRKSFDERYASRVSYWDEPSQDGTYTLVTIANRSLAPMSRITVTAELLPAWDGFGPFPSEDTLETAAYVWLPIYLPPCTAVTIRVSTNAFHHLLASGGYEYDPKRLSHWTTASLVYVDPVARWRLGGSSGPERDPADDPFGDSHSIMPSPSDRFPFMMVYKRDSHGTGESAVNKNIPVSVSNRSLGDCG